MEYKYKVIQESTNVTAEIRRNERRLAKLKLLKGMFTGQISDEQSIQRMKSERGNEKKILRNSKGGQ